MKTEIIQKVLIVNPDEKVLLLRRSKTDTRRPLEWDLPGGHLEEGEEMIAGVVREIKEEAGIEVQNTRVLYSQTEVRRWDKNEVNVVFIFYISLTKSSEVKLSFEHVEHAWVSIKEAVSMFEYPTHIEFIKYVIDNKLTA